MIHPVVRLIPPRFMKVIRADARIRGLGASGVEVPNLADGDYPVVVSEGGISSASSTILTIKK